MDLTPIESGLLIYAAITVYMCLLGGYILVKTKVVSLRALPFILGYSFFDWVVARIVYINFPEIPPQPIRILSEIVDNPQGILTTIYVYVKTGVMKIQWLAYVFFYSFSLGIFLLVRYMYRELPVPEILILPEVLASWAAYPAWFYVYVKTNKIFTLKAASILVGYQIFSWVVSLVMLYYLKSPYSVISMTRVLLNYPATLLTLIFIDKYRMENLAS